MWVTFGVSSTVFWVLKIWRKCFAKEQEEMPESINSRIFHAQQGCSFTDAHKTLMWQTLLFLNIEADGVEMLKFVTPNNDI